MIIVEGLDRCGKSTVVRALLKLLPDWSYRHYTKPPMQAYGYYAGFIADARPRVVLDRFHWSEEVYGGQYRGGSGFTQTDYMKIELMCLAQEARVVYMYDDVESIRSRWGDKEMFDTDALESLAARFEQTIEESKVPSMRARLDELVSPEGRPTEALARLASLVSEEASFASFAPPPSIGAGRLRDAKFFMIGPSPTLSGSDKDPDVQFPLALGHAEEAFWECLSYKLPWHKGYYTSVSNHPSGSLKNLIMSSTEKIVPPIICLGREAEAVVKKTMGDWPIIPMAHPAHELRNGSLSKWCLELRDSLGPIRAGGI